MAERIIDIRFVDKIVDPRKVTERSHGVMIERLLLVDGNGNINPDVTVYEDGGYLVIRGHGCIRKVPRTNIAYMDVIEVDEKPAKAGGK